MGRGRVKAPRLRGILSGHGSQGFWENKESEELFLRLERSDEQPDGTPGPVTGVASRRR